ncbi:glutathione S-transferase N-terminal domain-containing protein [Sutterella sp.]|uniref:glutathione S-transferase N-terminal domain-containing protein n=1 Tax=Sutterella sp. TaxID=1981025 RepID=UPI0026DEB612|nr:glutathione S-transferase N-terminal domain-containing protein [Sutterella sp.]MDO5531288.1 glutathione S-transferase N-terminal domain-containing protein [Sutterella sp.]
MMYLYSGPTCPFSHMSRILLYEKGCEFEIKTVDPEGLGQNQEDLAVIRMSPYGELPVLVERDLLLYNVFVVNEYIDERFPHPQLMPADPVGRARTRLFMHVLECELFPQVRVLQNPKASEERRKLAQRRLRESLDILSMRVGDTKFLLSDDFGMLDVILAPILWRLESWGVQFSATASKLEIYSQRLYARQSFIDSMTAQERSMRK